MNGIQSSHSFLDKLVERQLVFLSENLFKLRLGSGVLGSKYRTAVLIRLNRRLKRSYLTGYLNYFLFIHSNTWTEHGHINASVGNTQRLHGLRRHLTQTFSRYKR